MNRRPRTCVARLTLVVATTIVTIFAAPAATQPEEAPTPERIRAMTAAGELRAAVDAARALRAHREHRYGERSAPVAETLELEVVALARLHGGDPEGVDARLALARRALEIRRETAGRNDPRLAHAWYCVGLVHNLAGRPAGAVEPFAEALRIAEAHFGVGHPETENYVREYGTALFGTGRFDEALGLFERQHEIATAAHGPDSRERLRALYNLALGHQAAGDLRRAVRTLDDARSILERGDPVDRSTLAWVRSLQASISTMRGEVGPAIRDFEVALELARSAHGDAHPQTRDLRANLALALLEAGDAARARKELEAAMEGAMSTAADPSRRIRLSTLLGRAEFLDGDERRARRTFERLLADVPESSVSDPGIWSEFRLHYGRTLFALGEIEAALRQFRQALRQVTGEAGGAGLDRAEILAETGRAELALGRPAVARKRLSEAIDLIESIAGPNHRWIAFKGYLAEAEWIGGDPEAAAEIALDTATASTEFDRETIAVLLEREALASLARPRLARDVAVTAIVSGPAATDDRRERLYRHLIASRALTFDEASRRFATWIRTADPEEGDRFREWAGARTRLANLVLAGPRTGDPTYRTRVDRLRRRVDALEAKLARGDPRMRARIDDRMVDPDRIRASLGESEALVSYLRYRRLAKESSDRVPAYVAVVLRPADRSPTWIDLGPAQAIDRSIEAWLAAVEIPPRDPASAMHYRNASRQLRRLLWDPIAKLVEGATVVRVVPDGPVHRVSFAAFPAAGDGYLLESGPTFHYLTTERDLVRRSVDRAATGRGLLLVSDPAFDAGRRPADRGTSGFRVSPPSCAVFRDLRFAALPGTRREAKAVLSIWSKSGGETVLRLAGTDATETAVRMHAPGFRVLHLATHGYFLDDGCATTDRDSRGIGGLGGRADPAVRRAVPENPLLRSGVVLAGVNRRYDDDARGDDGVLTAEEVTTVDLSGVELAVLSACRTGTGTLLAGEGLFGLRRAFLLAGARSVVSSLWNVNDRDAGNWVEAFYRSHLAEGLSVPEAVSAASLEVLRTLRTDGLDDHPFHWAGWVAVGGP